MADILEFQYKYRFLSNFWPVSNGVTLDDSKVKFPTIEHAYQAAKSGNLLTYHKFSKLRSPGEAKRAGKSLVLRNDWDHIKLQVMYELVKQKFSQEPLKTQLLNTGDVLLIEGNKWNDTFWGVCRGKGMNHLGEILMRVREELR